ncbi:hypothetical protein [Myxococcus dinghuensis]|nr:hypothetical protein [Myxococcus dinghuensis]
MVLPGLDLVVVRMSEEDGRVSSSVLEFGAMERLVLDLVPPSAR